MADSPMGAALDYFAFSGSGHVACQRRHAQTQTLIAGCSIPLRMLRLV